MPKIGLRIIKSSIAVFLCFVIYLIRGEGIPFYSAIAAVLCMQPYVSNSRKVALNRIVGTFIGGIFGMFAMIIERQFIPPNIPIIKYIFISASIIPLIYFTVLLKKTSASYITCVVFMSVTVSHALDANPYLFAVNRVIDTLIGIFVSLFVNSFHLPKKKNHHLLFVTGFDGTLTDSSGKISNYTKIKLNHLIQKGANITIASELTPASLIPMIEGIDFKLPLITMNGAALYDINKKKYSYCKYIPYSTATDIIKIFKNHGLNCFVHTVIDDVLHIYYDKFTNPVEENFYHSKKLLPLENYICGPLPPKQDVLYFMAVDKLEIIKKLNKEISSLNCLNEISSFYYPDLYNKGYYIFIVCSKEASKENAIAELKKEYALDKAIAFASKKRDLSMILSTDFSYAVENADDKIKKAAKSIIGDSTNDTVIKTIEKLYHSKNLFE